MDHLQGRCSCQGDGAEVLCQCGHQYCICIFFSFLFVYVFSSIRNLAFVDKKIDKRIDKEIKTASSGSEGSSVFHDIGEKRFELRFPGAVAHLKNIFLLIWTFFENSRGPSIRCSWVRDRGGGADQWRLPLQQEQQTQLLACCGKLFKISQMLWSNIGNALVKHQKSLWCCGGLFL